MSETTFFRLLNEDDKEQALRTEVAMPTSQDLGPATYNVQQDTFRMMPAATFGYWASDDVRAIFSRLQPLERDSRPVRVGLQTSDDFRFVRAAWEVDPRAVLRSDHGGTTRWAPFAKGGEFAPFYADVHLVVNWANDGAEIRAFKNAYIRNERLYYRPGLTWPRRTTSGLSVRVMPGGCIFADKGPALFSERSDLLFVLALTNSRPFQLLVALNLGAADVAARSYEVGVMQRMPMPVAAPQDLSEAIGAAQRVQYLKCDVDSTDETSHSFILPTLVRTSDQSCRDGIAIWNAQLAMKGTEIRELCSQLDQLFFRLYGFSEVDRLVTDREVGNEVNGVRDIVTARQIVADLVSWAVGTVLGRFDVRLATGERPIPELPDPFDPLPAYSPGMLPDWRVPSDYPLQVDADGILVDDEGHEDDIVRRVEQVFELLWKEQSGARQQELCTMLGVASLRDWFQKTASGGFWDDHFKRYRKSRRNAPIYWPLQSPGGLYTIWLYYHRLNQDTLPKLLGPRYLGGKIERVRQAIAELRPQDGSTRSLSRQEEKRLGELDELLVDLEEFGSRIQQVIRLQNERGDTVGWSPNLDDGVVLNAAPLHALMPWPRKKKRAGKSISDLLVYWQDLEAGKYDWAHIAMHYWPGRVREKCREDRSLALAHGLDSEFFPGLREELREAAARASTDDDTTDAELPYDADADDEEDDE